MLDNARKLPDGKLLSSDRKAVLFRAVEGVRQSRGYSVAYVCGLAHVDERTYRRAMVSDGAGLGSTKLRNLAKVVASNQPLPSYDEQVLELCWHALIMKAAILWPSMGRPAQRHLCMYYLHCELGQTQQLVARIAGVSPQLVARIVARLEDRRDEDAQIEDCLDGLRLPVQTDPAA